MTDDDATELARVDEGVNERTEESVRAEVPPEQRDEEDA